MENQTQDKSQEYVKNLPQVVQDFVYDGVWEERTAEIAKKYSLGPGQTDTLINNVLFVLIGLDTPDTFTNLMTSELGISKLLASQIIEELETRVFEYVLNTVESQKLKVESKSKPEIKSGPADLEVKLSNQREEKKIFANIKTEIKKTPGTIGNVAYVPEVRPETVPMVEKNEKAQVRVPQTDTPQQKQEQPVRQPEPVQRPVSVPRFTVAQTNTQSQLLQPVSVQKPAQVLSDIINNNQNPTPTPQQPMQKPPQPETPKKYMDPYREPVQ